jgi:hypothetical protein
VRFFIFLIQIQILNLDRLGTGRNRNRSEPVRPVPTFSGPVPTGSVNPSRSTTHSLLLKPCLLAARRHRHKRPNAPSPLYAATCNKCRPCFSCHQPLTQKAHATMAPHLACVARQSPHHHDAALEMEPHHFGTEPSTRGRAAPANDSPTVTTATHDAVRSPPQNPPGRSYHRRDYSASVAVPREPTARRQPLSFTAGATDVCRSTTPSRCGSARGHCGHGWRGHVSPPPWRRRLRSSQARRCPHGSPHVYAAGLSEGSKEGEGREGGLCRWRCTAALVARAKASEQRKVLFVILNKNGWKFGIMGLPAADCRPRLHSHQTSFPFPAWP